MGMLKAALRVSLQSHQQPVALLESADRVLPAVKTADMYATLALLHLDGSTQAEYALAGHLPILHYRQRSGDTARLSMEQFPLGLIPGGRYASQRVCYSAGDIFLLLTDGITEVVNERDEEFGLARLEQLLNQHAAQPLPQIWEMVMGEVRQHGPNRMTRACCCSASGSSKIAHASACSSQCPRSRPSSALIVVWPRPEPRWN